MVFILGTLLPDAHCVHFALQRFYGVGPVVSSRICARFQIHSKLKVSQLSQQQIVGLQSFLAAPQTSATLPSFPRAAPDYQPPPAGTQLPPYPVTPETPEDTLRNMRFEGELRRTMRENIAHHKNIGSYVGRRHATGLPVRGQNTRNNAVTARKLNRIERRA
ncbi:mitochondrial 30S ribosomal protein S13 [Auricularia subglabra TFB-10046 SS5]|uniref:Mitochondrial 30S ribosomal protein S13 n=1 Tax=Auricularia subglabra (strain TFB-10046 / SS5) TaxID=717982 RepID=J0WTN7_AURST|nr:mitochondrial 30S ribosomal protein S13 [Auricularia subglabra TFB-10046 SS5]